MTINLIEKPVLTLDNWFAADDSSTMSDGNPLILFDGLRHLSRD